MPKGKREDIVRERLAEEAGLQSGRAFISRPYYLNEQTQGRLAKRIEEVYPHGTYKIEQMPTSLIDMLLSRRRSYFVIDPIGKLIDEGMRESVNLAHYGGVSAPVDVDQMGHGSGGTPQVTIEHLTVAQNVNSLAETQHNVAELSRAFAYGTGD